MPCSPFVHFGRCFSSGILNVSLGYPENSYKTYSKIAGRLPGIVLTVTNLFCFIFHKITGAAGHASLVRKLTSFRRSIPEETAAGQFLSLRHQKERLPKREAVLFADGRLPGIEPELSVPQTDALTVIL